MFVCETCGKEVEAEMFEVWTHVRGGLFAWWCKNCHRYKKDNEIGRSCPICGRNYFKDKHQIVGKEIQTKSVGS